MPPDRLRFLVRAFVVVLLLLAGSTVAFPQKITFGVLAGASLSDDYRSASRTFLSGDIQHAENASQWFMIGPTVDFAFNDRVSVEVDAIRRRIRSRQLTILGRPLSLGFVVGVGLTKLLKDRSFPEFMFGATSDSHTPIAGIRIGVPVIENLTLEADALYRPTHVIDGPLQPDGSIQETGSPSGFLTWEFPVLAKYKVSVARVAPVFELGPAFRITAHTQSQNYAHYGAAAGIGVSTNVWKMNVSPTLRYTRWARDKTRFGSEPANGTRPDQLELVVGFTF